MKDNPRLFIGTMYSGENEFGECCDMINSQTYKNYKHFVYKDLNYKDAHDALYNEFMSRADEFDIMIKVDADMVIRENTFFAWVIEQFKNDEELDMLTMALHDFYLNEHIWGMHAYRNTVKWDTGDEIVYTDRMHIQNTIRKHNWHHGKIADHCKNPSPFQAFHFGFHRALKAVQPGRVKAKLDGNWQVIERIYVNSLKNRDIRLLYSLAGAEEVYSGYYNEDNISYNKKLENLFDKKYNKLPFGKLSSIIKQKRAWRLGFLPKKVSYFYIFFIFRIKTFFRLKFKVRKHRLFIQ